MSEQLTEVAQDIVNAIYRLPIHVWKPRNKGYFKTTCYECHGTMHRVYGGDVCDCYTCNGAGVIPSGERVMDYKLLGQLMANVVYGDGLEPLPDGIPTECVLAVKLLINAMGRVAQQEGGEG